MRKPSIVCAVALAAAGCASKPVNTGDDRGAVGSPVSGRLATASAALGDSAGASQVAGPAEAPRAASSEQRLQASFDEAKALYDKGEFADAAEQFRQVYTYSPRSRLAEEGLFWTGEAAFQASDHQFALEVYEKFLREYPASMHYPEATARIFQIGKLYVEERAKKRSWFLGINKTDTSFGIDILTKFVEKRDRHPLAPEALFLVGEAQARDDEPEKSIETWQRLVKEYPGTPWARLGEYRIALGFLSLSYGVEYDKRPIVTALRRLRAYVRKYPTGDNVQEAQAKLASLEEELALHELGTAKRYARNDRFVSAQIYLNAIRREYPNTKAAQEATRLSTVWDNPPLPPMTDDEIK